jgi:hypothetical protein
VTDNVVLFPGFKRESPPQTVEEIVDKVTQTRKEHVEGVMADLIPEFIHLFGSYGLDVSSDEYIKDVAMIMESVKSMISRQYNLDHPFHKMVDNIFDFSYNEDNTVAYTYKFPNTDEE